MNIYHVTFSQSQRTVAVEEWFTVALAAKRAKIKIPTECNHGICGTCTVMTDQGEVRACITLVSPQMIVEL